MSQAEDIYPHTDIPDDGAPPVNGLEDYGFVNGRPNGHGGGEDGDIIPDLKDLGAGNALNWVDLSNWDNEPVPERDGLFVIVYHSIKQACFPVKAAPARSIIELMKDIAHVIGKDWLGSMPETGRPSI